MKPIYVLAVAKKQSKADLATTDLIKAQHWQELLFHQGEDVQIIELTPDCVETITSIYEDSAAEEEQAKTKK